MAFERLQLIITGLVQGVGFRPCVYQLACELGLTGLVKNTPGGVLVEVQGDRASQFAEKIKSKLPPLAKLTGITCKKIPSIALERQFEIVASDEGIGRTMISPDMGICHACLSELLAPESRYYLYPFLNCTHCGPRLTITQSLPYDRCKTSMALFPLCSACQKSYSDPCDRRYHAQPTACHHCGPQFSHAIATMAQAIHAGKILAVKGMGGYQLICDGRNENTIETLRQRKNRPAKPFALMALNLKSASQIIKLSAEEAVLLKSQARPIVLASKKESFLPEGIAPGLNRLGVMLPSTPAHYLLFHALSGEPHGRAWLEEINPNILVVTSANLSGKPLYVDDEKAQNELSTVADLLVSYNRNIVTRVDDSVVTVVNQVPLFIRRARGYIPEPIKLPCHIPVTLAFGGQLKNTFCITRGDEAFVSQHIGSLSNRETIDFFHESLTHLQKFLGVKLERLACDWHPDFYTSQLLSEYDLTCVAVQHHHAHLASVAAEHHLIKPALGLALDGYGYGNDGHAWGGELLKLVNTSFERLSSFYPLPQPGGDRAAREPWRMAAAVLHHLNQDEEIMRRFSSLPRAALLSRWLACDPAMPVTTSCGRLFDAASALLGVNLISSYEGQAAALLESLVTCPKVDQNGWDFKQGSLNLLPLFERMLSLDPTAGANLFHGTLIAGLTEWIVSWSKKTAIKTILLSGGCFLNKVLSEGLSQELSRLDFEVYLPQKLPPNDGGLSLGQAWVAGRTR